MHSPTGKQDAQPEKRPLQIRIDAELIERFRAVAAANHRTLTGELRHLMEQHVAEAERGVHQLHPDERAVA